MFLIKLYKAITKTTNHNHMIANKNKRYLLYLIIVIITNSCEYQTDETYFNKVDKNVALPDLTVNLNLDHNSDTIYIYNYSNIKLSLNLTNKKLYDVRFYINDKKVEDIYQESINNYSLCIDISKFQEAKVRAEIYTSTGTGSMADKIHAEAFIFKTKEWVLIRSSEKPIIDCDIVDGRLKVTWTPIKNSTNNKYIISTSDSSFSTYNNWYIDSSYVGGKKGISIHYDDNGASGYSIYREINYPYPKVSLNNKDSFLLSWEQCKFYNNIKGYRIRLNNNSFELKPTETNFVFKSGRLGEHYFIQFDILLKDYYHDNTAYIYCDNLFGYYQISIINEYAQFNSSYFPLIGTSMYYWSYIDNVQTLFKYSFETKSIINSKTLSFNYFAVSPNNKYILCDTYNDNRLKLFDANNLELIKSIPTPNSSYTSLNVTDIGTSVFYDFAKQSMLVYDLLSEKIINEIPTSSYVYQYKISANGKYIFEPKMNTLYKTGTGTTFTKIWGDENNSNQYNYFEFLPDKKNQIALYDGNMFYIKNCFDFSDVASFSLRGTTLINIDYSKNRILTYKDSMLYVFSLINGDLLYSIPSYSVSNNSRLFNNYIIFNNCQLNLNSL